MSTSLPRRNNDFSFKVDLVDFIEELAWRFPDLEDSAIVEASCDFDSRAICYRAFCITTYTDALNNI